MKLLNWLRDLGRPTPSTQDDSELDPDDPFPEPVEVEITDVFDLHTIQPREVKLVVEEYLHQAHEWDFGACESFTARALVCSVKWYVQYWRRHLL